MIASDQYLKQCSGCTLENVVKLSESNSTVEPILTIKDPKTGKVIFTLDETAINDNFFYLNASVKTQPEDILTNEYVGLIGLDMSGRSDTYLKDGIYGSQEKDSNSIHPFVMYRDPFDKSSPDETYTWRGIYFNNLSPQEWNIHNEVVTSEMRKSGDISFSITATGGVGNLYFF